MLTCVIVSAEASMSASPAWTMCSSSTVSMGATSPGTRSSKLNIRRSSEEIGELCEMRITANKKHIYQIFREQIEQNIKNSQ